MGKKIQIGLWIVIAVAVFIAIGGLVYNLARATYESPVHPEVTFEFADLGTVKMELYPEYAPNTVKNIIKLVQMGYYDGRVMYGKDEICLYLGRNIYGDIDFVKASEIDPSLVTDPESDYEYAIKGEFLANGFEQNTLNHEKGVVTFLRNNYGSTVLEESYNSGDTQMAIMMNNQASSLNGSYAAFGRITEGMELLEKMYNEYEIAPKDPETSSQNQDEAIEKFATYPIISKATVDTHGIEYGNPEIIEAFDYDEYMYQMMSSYYGEQ